MDQNPNKRHKSTVINEKAINILIPNGEFTLETVMAVSLLKFLHPVQHIDQLISDDDEAKVASFLHKRIHDPETFVIGAGNVYLPQLHTFHWSPDKPQGRNRGNSNNKSKTRKKKRQIPHHYFNDSKRCKVVPLATVGLVYKMYGKLIISKITNMPLSDSNIDWLFERAYFDYIEIIDAYVRGIRLYNFKDVLPKPRFKSDQHTLPLFVKMYNPIEAENIEKTRILKFCQVVDILNNAFANYIKYFAFSFIHGKQVVNDAYSAATSGSNFEKYKTLANPEIFKKILILPEFIPWKEHLFNYEKDHNLVGQCIYVVYQDSSKDWRIAAVPTQPSSFQSRKKLPDSWCGLDKQELREITGIDDINFIHAQGFIGGADSLVSCLKLAILALNNRT